MKSILGGMGAVAFAFLVSACAPAGPAKSLVKAEIEKLLPPYVQLETREIQRSPMRQIMGTTLPAGSFQLDVHCIVSAREPLYTRVPLRSAWEASEWPEVVRGNFEHWHELASWRNVYFGGPSFRDGVPEFPEILLSAAERGARKEVWAKLVAEPRGKGWTFDLVGGDPSHLFDPARPQKDFSSKAVVYGSEAFRRSLKEQEDAHAKQLEQWKIMQRIGPKIKELEKNERGLAYAHRDEIEQKYAPFERLKRAAQERYEKNMGDAWIQSKGDSKRYDQIVRAAKDRFTKDEEAYAGALAARQVEDGNAFNWAKAETEKRIRDLKQNAGLLKF